MMSKRNTFFRRSSIARFPILGVLLLTGCLEGTRDFDEKDFKGSTKMLCQEENYKGSPLEAASYVIYYNENERIGNIGQFVYIGDYVKSDPVQLAHLFETGNAIVTDSTISLYLDSSREIESSSITINRKNLKTQLNGRNMNCHITDDDKLLSFSTDLLQKHLAHKKEQKAANKI